MNISKQVKLTAEQENVLNAIKDIRKQILCIKIPSRYLNGNTKQKTIITHKKHWKK